jgi:hypothetical protein
MDSIGIAALECRKKGPPGRECTSDTAFRIKSSVVANPCVSQVAKHAHGCEPSAGRAIVGASSQGLAD